jgi:hypothetical protein
LELRRADVQIHMHRQKKRPLKKLCFCAQAQAENTGVVSLQPQLACELCGRAAVPSPSCLIFGESPLTSPKRPGFCPGESWHVGPGSPSVPIVTAVVDILAQCRSSVIFGPAQSRRVVVEGRVGSGRWGGVLQVTVFKSQLVLSYCGLAGNDRASLPLVFPTAFLCDLQVPLPERSWMV